MALVIIVDLIVSTGVRTSLRRGRPTRSASSPWLAVLFGLGIWYVSRGALRGEFLAGYLTEYSLSVDNLFVFMLIMADLRVPRKLQQFALMFGIIIALILRGILIVLGAAAIERFAGSSSSSARS